MTVLAGAVEKDGVAAPPTLYVSFQTSYLMVSDEEPMDEGVHLKALPEYPSVLWVYAWIFALALHQKPLNMKFGKTHI